MATTLILIGMLICMALVAGGLLLYAIRLNNELVKLKNDIDRSFANVDVFLKQRHDELPKLVETCKGYMQHEQKTFQAITDARTAWMRAATPADKMQADNMMTGALKSLFAVSENYPELKANTNFMQLQGRITDLEEKIAAQRTIFNEDANRYNIRIGQVPANFIAGFKGMTPHPLFEATAEDRQDVPIKFT
jgi:LemA protein